MRSFIATALVMGMAFAPLVAQDWDAQRSAKGWCRLDPIDGTGTFYDAASRRFHQWTPGLGTTKTINAVNMDAAPDRWMIDGETLWLVVGNVLKKYRTDGKLEDEFKLPAEVADLELVPQDGFYLSFKAVKPYVEKRNLKSGSVMWTYGDKPKKDEISSRSLHRIAVNGDRNLIVASGDSLFVELVDHKKGKALGQAVFAYKDQVPPPIQLGDRDRPPLVWGFAQNVAFQALPASSVPALGLTGLVLARLDFSNSAVEFLPTPFSEAHLLVGIQEDRAVFLAPSGGFVFAPVH